MTKVTIRRSADAGSDRHRKHYHDVLVEPPPPKRRSRRRLANGREEFEHLADYLRGLKSSVLIGFEATGNYHRPLAYFLHREGFELRLIPNLALARTREAMRNSWDKNDPKDAPVILHLLKTGLTQTWHDPIVNGINECPGTFQDSFPGDAGARTCLEYGPQPLFLAVFPGD